MHLYLFLILSDVESCGVGFGMVFEKVCILSFAEIGVIGSISVVTAKMLVTSLMAWFGGDLAVTETLHTHPSPSCLYFPGGSAVYQSNEYS